MFTNTKVALAAVLVLGTASMALAGSENTEDRGGYVIAGSTDGVNPVYHPGRFPKASKAASTGNARKASERGRGSYAQARVQPSPSAAPIATPRPLTAFEQNWFDFQNHTY